MTKGEGGESVWIATKNAGHFSRNGRGAGNEVEGGRGEGSGCRCVGENGRERSGDDKGQKADGARKRAGEKGRRTEESFCLIFFLF